MTHTEVLDDAGSTRTKELHSRFREETTPGSSQGLFPGTQTSPQGRHEDIPDLNEAALAEIDAAYDAPLRMPGGMTSVIPDMQSGSGEAFPGVVDGPCVDPEMHAVKRHGLLPQAPECAAAEPCGWPGFTSADLEKIDAIVSFRSDGWSPTRNIPPKFTAAGPDSVSRNGRAVRNSPGMPACDTAHAGNFPICPALKRLTSRSVRGSQRPLLKRESNRYRLRLTCGPVQATHIPTQSAAGHLPTMSHDASQLTSLWLREPEMICNELVASACPTPVACIARPRKNVGHAPARFHDTAPVPGHHRPSRRGRFTPFDDVMLSEIDGWMNGTAGAGHRPADRNRDRVKVTTVGFCSGSARTSNAISDLSRSVW